MHGGSIGCASSGAVRANGAPRIAITVTTTDKIERRNRKEAVLRAREAYHGDDCGLLYRGPAVYCSLDCAIADA